MTTTLPTGQASLTDPSSPLDSTDPAARVPASPPDPFAPLSVSQMVGAVADMAVEKAQHPAAFLVRSLVGGGMVAFGVLLSLMVSTGISTPGLASLVMGLAFGMSFVLILMSGMSLITADMAAGALAVLQRRLSAGAYLRLLGIGMFGNVAGAAVFTTLCAAAGGPYLGGFADRAAAVAAAKTSSSILSEILLAVVCTWFLQTAMCLYFKARSEPAKMAFAFYGPFAFVIGGTQHVIANVGFLGMPLLLSAFHPDAPESVVTWGFGSEGILTNLGFTTLGNFIGGTLFVALPFFVISRLQDAGK